MYLHILAAYFALYWWTCFLGMRRSLALAATLSFMLSGYVLVLGRSWGTVLVTFFWMIPLVIAVTILPPGSCRRTMDPGHRDSHRPVLLCRIPQGWVYNLCVFMLVLLVLVWTKSLPKSRLYPAVTALLLGLAICTPVLVPQTMEAKRFYSNRQLGKDLGIQRAFASMMLPFPLAKLEVTEKEPSYNQYIPLMGRAGQQTLSWRPVLFRDLFSQHHATGVSALHWLSLE